jgi:hypothetical protein
MECRTRKPGGVPQSALVRSLTFVRDDRARSKRKYFTQHSQAILEKLNFATFSVIPAHRNFTDSQSGMLREIKQFDIEGEPVEVGGLQNWAAHIETKSLEPALRIPKRQPIRDAHEQVEHAASLLASPRLMNANQSAIQGARP